MERTTLTPQDLQEKIQQNHKLLILDVRDPEKYGSGTLHVDGVQTGNIPYLAMKADENNVKEQIAKLSTEVEIVTVCTSGNKAQKAAALLREKGLTAVALEGGLTAWNKQQP